MISLDPHATIPTTYKECQCYLEAEKPLFGLRSRQNTIALVAKNAPQHIQEGRQRLTVDLMYRVICA